MELIVSFFSSFFMSVFLPPCFSTEASGIKAFLILFFFLYFSSLWTQRARGLEDTRRSQSSVLNSLVGISWLDYAQFHAHGMP